MTTGSMKLDPGWILLDTIPKIRYIMNLKAWIPNEFNLDRMKMDLVIFFIFLMWINSDVVSLKCGVCIIS